MLNFVKMWIATKYDRRAVTALEYALLAAVLGTIIIAGFTTDIAPAITAKLKTAITGVAPPAG